MIETLVGFAAIFVLALLRVPLAISMGAVGLAGITYVRGWEPALASTAQVVYETGFAYTLSVVPLFILMGNFVARAGLAHELFQAAYAFIGHLRGGLAHATVAACAGFGAICGSSIATAATKRLRDDARAARCDRTVAGDRTKLRAIRAARLPAIGNANAARRSACARPAPQADRDTARIAERTARTETAIAAIACNGLCDDAARQRTKRIDPAGGLHRDET